MSTRHLFSALSLLALILASSGASAFAQENNPSPLTATLSLGSSGPQVIKLQKLLNTDPDTRIAQTGPGSPGYETDRFGPLTKAAVIRFQEKHAATVLTPVGLTRGNGRVGPYTRNALNTLAPQTPPSQGVPAPAAASPVTNQSVTDYLVTEKEKTDIYAGDAMIAAVQKKILAAINAGITSGGTTAITVPSISPTEVPSVIIQTISPRLGSPGSRVSLTGNGILSNSVVYLGSDYIVRSLTRDTFGNISFVIPPIPPKRYDLAIGTNGVLSNTVMFVVLGPDSKPVRIQNISPTTTTFNGSLTVTGSGFTPQNNVVITSYQTITGVPSPNGTTMTVQLAPEVLRESARVGHGTSSIPMLLSVVNDNGFSSSEEPFFMKL